MKKLLLTLCLALAPLTGCAAAGTAGAIVQAATSSAPLGDRITMDERGMYAVEALYNAVEGAYVTADQHGLVTPALRAQARPILLKMRNARNALRTAYRVGDATSWAARLAELQQLKTQVAALIPAA